MFDAIVVGSGMSGGWAAKELTQKGLKTLVIERGKKLTHGVDYLDTLYPWELANRGKVAQEELDAHYKVQQKCYAFTTGNQHLWVRDDLHPYETPEDKPFQWIRGYHLGGRSLLWARHAYRWSNLDFEANLKDGHGVDWPIRYEDIAPWYDHVEKFAGVTGEQVGLPQLPDGQFQPAMDLNAGEKWFKDKIETAFPGRKLIMGRLAHLTQPTEEQTALGRGSCQYRHLCYRGCSYGAYFSSLSATLPAAEATGNLTILADSVVAGVVMDPATGKARGVRVINVNTKEESIQEAKIIFLCASTINSALVLLNSADEANPNGIANSSDQVGRNLMDHLSGIRGRGKIPGLEDRYYEGRRPGGFYIPRFRNLDNADREHNRGYGIQGSAQRDDWARGNWQEGVGEELKSNLRDAGQWSLGLGGFGEMLPNAENRVTLHRSKKDQWGIPIPHISCGYGPNEAKISQRLIDDMHEMLVAAGCTDIKMGKPESLAPGYGIHEMGTARMGRDPKTSVLNKWNQAHDVPNLFVTDGAAMASSACQNPSLTYMAMTARAANHAAELLKEGAL